MSCLLLCPVSLSDALAMVLAELLESQWSSTQQKPSADRATFVSPALIVMSYWEQNWRKSLKLITVDDVPPSQQLQVSRWLKIRCEHLLDCSNELEAECLIQEFDDYQDACC